MTHTRVYAADAATRLDTNLDGQISMQEAADFAVRTARASPLVTAPLAILVMPIVALVPPLERIGERSKSIVVRAFNTPPALRAHAIPR